MLSKTDEGDDATSSRAQAWLPRLLGLEAGQTPFPWQERLLREQFSKGAIPSALDLPTGLGKTSVIGIWAAARAAGARLPRRLVYVVDRRAVVDQATAEAERIRAFVDETPQLKLALGLSRPLPISTLRGQFVDNREWLEDPSSPAIVVGTVDMIGSRLLFSGYRCSRRMRPYHAAMLGSDALLVLDEAHLVPAFEALVRAASLDDALKPQAPSRDVVPPLRVMSLSATARVETSAFQLDATDRQHPTVQRRLEASKALHVADAVAPDALATVLAERAWKLSAAAKEPARVIVFVDSRRTAQAVHQSLQVLAKGDGVLPERAIETVLFVGGRRVAERVDAASTLERLGMLGGARGARELPVFVIATSAGEVGVDLDADHAVMDLVEWERMVQRLGRVNRRGDGRAEVWVHPTTADPKTISALEKIAKFEPGEDEDDEVDESPDDEESSAAASKKLNDDERRRAERWNRRQATLRALRSLAGIAGASDASPRALGELKAKAEQARTLAQATTPPPLHPELSRPVVEAWSMTSLEEHTGRPDVRPWLRGWVDEEAQTTIVWRRLLPRANDAEAFFEAAPVETAELLESESVVVIDWLNKRIKHLSKSSEMARDRLPRDIESVDAAIIATRTPPAEHEAIVFVLDDKPRGFTLGELATMDKKRLERLLRARTVVVDTRFGGLDEHGLLDPSSHHASDVSEAGDLGFRVREVETLDGLGVDPNWRVEASFVLRTSQDGDALAWLVIETDRTRPSTTADGRSTGREQALSEHEAFAERHARRIAEQLELAPAKRELLALAARLHDEGKKAERWQRAFRAPVDKRPLGKTTSRPIQSILAGYRHELGSLSYAERDPDVAGLGAQDRDLVLHLIAAHHGFARPVLRTDGFDDAPPSLLEERAREIALRFARAEKQWGPWGLAWWEALLRAADQAASRENDEMGGKRG